jgi:hypothetical protein
VIQHFNVSNGFLIVGQLSIHLIEQHSSAGPNAAHPVAVDLIRPNLAGMR